MAVYPNYWPIVHTIEINPGAPATDLTQESIAMALDQHRHLLDRACASRALFTEFRIGPVHWRYDLDRMDWTPRPNNITREWWAWKFESGEVIHTEMMCRWGISC